MQISLKSIRILVKIRGKTWQAQLGNWQKSEFAHLKNCMYISGLSHKQQVSSRPHCRVVRKVNWKMVKNCIRNRSRPDEIDTTTQICTSLKSEFYFRFRLPPSTKSTRWFVTPQFGFLWRSVGRYVHHNRETEKNWILHTSKIGNLLPVCLRNNRHLADYISEPYAKFYGKW